MLNRREISACKLSGMVFGVCVGVAVMVLDSVGSICKTYGTSIMGKYNSPKHYCNRKGRV